MVEIYAVNQKNRLHSEQYNKLLSFISEDRMERINRFINWNDAQRSLIAEVLIRSLILPRLNIDNNQIHFTKNKYGKPYLKNFEHFHFNISHSGEWVVCAVSNSEVGVDIEQIKPVDLDVAKRYFSEAEYDSIAAQPEENRVKQFFNLWSMKESYIKAIGKGLNLALGDFTIVREGEKYLLKSSAENTFFNINNYDVIEGYTLAICYSKLIQNVRLNIFSLSDFLHHIRNLTTTNSVISGLFTQGK